MPRNTTKSINLTEDEGVHLAEKLIGEGIKARAKTSRKSHRKFWADVKRDIINAVKDAAT